MDTKQTRPAPEWLSKRKDTNPEKWRGAQAAPLIAATFADPTSGLVQATYSTEGIGALLRAYSLVQARYGFADLDTVALDHRQNPQTMQVAATWWAQEMTNRALATTAKHWNDGTGAALARAIEKIPNPIDQLRAAMPYLHTANSQAISRAIGKTNPELVKSLARFRKKTRAFLGEMYAPSTDTAEFGDLRSGRKNARWDETQVAALAQCIDEFLADQRQKLHQAQPVENGRPQSLVPETTGDPDLWHPVIPAPVNLSRPHIGRIGSKRRPTDSGRTIAYPSRALTDPHRRVFVRRQRHKSALVVLDMSGSMNYTEQQLDEIIEHARGAVVVGYSAQNDHDPNFYLLAKDGHRVERIPEVCGGNGCDGTALSYAVNKYRKNQATPVVWVSDGYVTGAKSRGSVGLSRDMIARLERHKVTQVENMAEAIDLLGKMANGHRPAAKIGAQLIERAGL